MSEMKSNPLIVLASVCLVLSAGAELLPGGDFQLYKPGEPTVTATLTGGWVPWNGVIPPTDLSISGGGSANYSDGTTGTTVDLHGWTKVQGNADILGNGPDGSAAFNAFGSWGGQTRIRSADSLGTVQAGGVHTISVLVGGPDTGPIQGPLAFHLLADGVQLTPTSSVNPTLPNGGAFQEISRTYGGAAIADHIGASLTIVLGVEDANTAGNRVIFDQVSIAITGTDPDPDPDPDPGADPTPVISEFMAANNGSLTLPDGTKPDWIEIHNPSASSINLAGWHLTDKADNLTRWTFPQGVQLAPHAYLVVYASGEDRFDPESGHHTNFSLRAEGEYLALVRPDGTIHQEFAPAFPPQRGDISYGLAPDGESFGYFAIPTPGSANGGTFAGFAEDAIFSHRRGFYEEPFQLDITTATPGAALVYSTDGSTPGPDSPRLAAPDAFTPPVLSLEITSTTIVRVFAEKDGYGNSTTITHTYLFLDEVIANPAMATSITQDALWGPQMRDALLEIPTISLVTQEDIPTEPIASPPEIPVSIEMIFPDGKPGFQMEAGVERFGGPYSIFAKSALRVSFKGIYGPTRLNVDLFSDTPYGGDTAVESFDQILLRNGSHDSLFAPQYSHSRGVYFRNRYFFDRQIEMGHLSMRGKFVHVYLNGTYYGHFHLMERPNADFMATHQGGEEEEYDIMVGRSGIFARQGDSTAWDHLVSNINNYEIVQDYMDVDNYIDYMLLNFYGGNDHDWYPHHNWIAGRKREPGGKFQFFMWDNDFLIRHGGNSTTGSTTNTIDNGGPGNLLPSLLQHPEFKLRMADRAQRHFFNGGVLTTERVQADITELAERISRTLIPETARWGTTTEVLYTPDSFQTYVNWIVDINAVSRTGVVINQMRAAGIYPSIDAPELIVSGARVSLRSSTPFYYMTDGTDPRLTGGGIHPDAIRVDGNGAATDPVALVARGATWRYYDHGHEPAPAGGLTWRDPGYAAGAWPAGPAILGFAGTGTTNPIGTQTRRYVDGTSTQVTTTYFRHEFQVDALPADADLTMEILRDDGAIVYLNGVELLRENMAAGPVTYDTWAASVVGTPAQNTYFERASDAVHLLQPGVNVLAAEVHQCNGTSSDKYFDVALTVTPAPEPIEVPVHLASGIRARAYHNGEWSALSDGSLLLDLPEPSLLHQWDFEGDGDLLEPGWTVGGGAALDVDIDPDAEPPPSVARNVAAQGFDSAHLRVYEPLGVTLTWALPTTGFGGITLAWETRRSGQGAGIQTVTFTTDGQDWRPLDSYPVFDAAPQPKSFDLTGVSAVENNPHFAVRVTFAQGDGGASGNNRFDNVTLTGILLPDAPPPAAIVFDALPAGTSSGAALSAVVVRLLDADGHPAVSYNGPVALSLVGDGGLTGTLIVDAVHGTATFDDLVLTGVGAFQLVAAADGLDPATSAAFRSLTLTDLVVPYFIQGEQDATHDNNDRVPFAWRARIDGLEPGATYRFANRVVLPADAPTNDGAGNMIFITSATENWIRTTDSPRFREGDLGARHFTFTAESGGSFTGWFLTEPSGNARFTPGNTLHFRLLLNDGAGGEESAFMLTTSQSAQVIRFGAAPGEGTAIIGESATAARRLVLLYHDASGATRPLAATPVEITGAEVDSRYAAFYETIVATNQSHWGAIFPNHLPTGLRRIEIRSADGDATLLDTRINNDGFPGTINPSGGLDVPILLDADAGLPVFLPGGSALWHTATHWSTGIVPDAPGAAAIVNAPVAGDRNVNVNAAATVGSLRVNQAGTDYRNRIRTNDNNGSLVFDGGAQPAALRVEGAGGAGHVDLDFVNPSTLATDLILLVNQADGGDPQQGALRLQQAWTGPGGLVKQGPGMASLTGEGKSFTGPVVIEQGALRVTGPAVPAAASGVTIHPGGQLRLVSAGSAEVPRVHHFGGGPVHIGGPGRGGDLPPAQELGVLGALRYDPGSQENLATLANALHLTAESGIHVDGARNVLRLDGPIAGHGHGLNKTGGGTLELAAESPAAPPVTVHTGTLSVTGNHPAAITLAAGTSVTGSGSVGAISGAGSVETAAATLTATRCSAARIAAVLASPGAAGNGALVLTDPDSPLPAAPATIDLFLDPVAPLQPGDRLQGGLATPEGLDLADALADTIIHLFLADPDGEIEHLRQTYRAVDPAELLTCSVAGHTLEVLQGGVPATYGQWRNLHFDDPAERADENISGPAATGATGTANLVRYAFNLAPGASVEPAMLRLDSETETLRFAFDPGKSDIVWIVRASNDLVDWPEILFDSRHDEAPAADPDGPISIPYPAGRPRLFLRLELRLAE